VSEPIEARKLATLVPMSEEALRDAQETAAAYHRFMNATPEQHRQWLREAAERRAAERAAATPVELTLDALLDKLGWTREYAEHVVQPYCDCGDSSDGWDTCQHARDLGVER
jgi:hypothetical protein